MSIYNLGMAVQVDELHQGVPEALVRALQRAPLLLPLSGRDVPHMQVVFLLKIQIIFS